MSKIKSFKDYQKKYKHVKSQLLSFSKKEIEEYNKREKPEDPNHLLKGRKWVLLGDTYYEIPRPIRLSWFRGLNAGVKFTTCALLGCAVIGGAATPIVLTMMNKKDGGGGGGEKEISLNKTELELGLYGDFKLVVNNLPTGKTVKWSSENKEYVAVADDGIVTGLSKGKTTNIIAEVEGKKLTCKVTVKETPSDPTISDHLIYNYVAATNNEEAHYEISCDNSFNKSTLVIPETYESKTYGKLKVTGFYGYKAFLNKYYLKHVVIPEGFKIIPGGEGGAYEGTFKGAIALEDVILPSTLEEIGPRAFEGCTSLVSINIESTNVSKIGNYAFNNDTSLKSINLGSSVKEIGSYAFNNDTSLESINLNNVEKIGDHAFNSATSLKSINLGSSTSIGEYAFLKCSSLQEVAWGDNQKITSIPKGCFEDCDSLKEVKLPASTLSLSEDSFCSCDNLEKITINEKLETLDGSCFRECKKLINFSVESGNAKFKSSDDNKFLIDYSGTTIIAYPSSTGELDLSSSTYTKIGKYAFARSAVATAKLSNTITEIGEGAFSNCASLSSIDFNSATITAIAKDCFKYCTSLTSIALPTTVTAINEEAFNYCSQLSSVNFSDLTSLETLGKLCFGHCGFDDNSSITIGSSVKEIGFCSFDGCSSLGGTNITYTSRPTSYTIFYTVDYGTEQTKSTEFYPTEHKELAINYLKSATDTSGTYRYRWVKNS